jgi:hypothetical protein
MAENSTPETQNLADERPRDDARDSSADDRTEPPAEVQQELEDEDSFEATDN